LPPLEFCFGTSPIQAEKSRPDEAAYRRGDLFDKRRKLMESWAAFCAKAPARDTGKVIAIGARR